VVGKRETRKPDRGIVTIEVTLTNQRGEVVQRGENDMMVWRTPSA
jgi:acyl dehydratase